MSVPARALDDDLLGGPQPGGRHRRRAAAPTRRRTHGRARRRSSRTRRPRASQAPAPSAARTHTAPPRISPQGAPRCSEIQPISGAPSGRPAHEAHEVQRHDPAAHLRIDAELHVAVVGDGEDQRGRPRRDEQHGERHEARHQAGHDASGRRRSPRSRRGSAAAGAGCGGWTAAHRSASRRRRTWTAARTPRRPRSNTSRAIRAMVTW